MSSPQSSQQLIEQEVKLVEDSYSQVRTAQEDFFATKIRTSEDGLYQVLPTARNVLEKLEAYFATYTKAEQYLQQRGLTLPIATQENRDIRLAVKEYWQEVDAKRIPGSKEEREIFVGKKTSERFWIKEILAKFEDPKVKQQAEVALKKIWHNHNEMKFVDTRSHKTSQITVSSGIAISQLVQQFLPYFLPAVPGAPFVLIPLLSCLLTSATHMLSEQFIGNESQDPKPSKVHPDIAPSEIDCVIVQMQEQKKENVEQAAVNRLTEISLDLEKIISSHEPSSEKALKHGLLIAANVLGGNLLAILAGFGLPAKILALVGQIASLIVTYTLPKVYPQYFITSPTPLPSRGSLKLGFQNPLSLVIQTLAQNGLQPGSTEQKELQSLSLLVSATSRVSMNFGQESHRDTDLKSTKPKESEKTGFLSSLSGSISSLWTTRPKPQENTERDLAAEASLYV